MGPFEGKSWPKEGNTDAELKELSLACGREEGVRTAALRWGTLSELLAHRSHGADQLLSCAGRDRVVLTVQTWSRGFSPTGFR